MSAEPTILINNVNDKKRKNKIMSFCIMNGIKGKVIGKEQYHQSLTALYEERQKRLWKVTFQKKCSLSVMQERSLTDFFSSFGKRR